MFIKVSGKRRTKREPVNDSYPSAVIRDWDTEKLVHVVVSQVRILQIFEPLVYVE